MPDLFTSYQLNESVKTAREQYLSTNKITKDEFDKLLALEPALQRGKYIEWMAKRFSEAKANHFGKAKLEPRWLEWLSVSIRAFDLLLSKHRITDKNERDINAILSLEDLIAIIKKHRIKVGIAERRQSGLDFTGLVEDTDYKSIYKSDKALAVEVLTFKASAQLGVGTGWCISAINDGREAESRRDWEQVQGSKIRTFFIFDLLHLQDRQDRIWAVAVFPRYQHNMILQRVHLQYNIESSNFEYGKDVFEVVDGVNNKNRPTGNAAHAHYIKKSDVTAHMSKLGIADKFEQLFAYE